MKDPDFEQPTLSESGVCALTTVTIGLGWFQTKKMKLQIIL